MMEHTCCFLVFWNEGPLCDGSATLYVPQVWDPCAGSEHLLARSSLQEVCRIHFLRMILKQIRASNLKTYEQMILHESNTASA